MLAVFLFYIHVAFSQAEGFHYTEEQVAEAQERITAEMPAEVRREYYESPSRRDYTAHIREMTPELRQMMIEYMRKMAYPLPGCTAPGWEASMFMFRDEAMVQKFVSKWFDEGEFSNYGAYLGGYADPGVIRLMGPYLFDATGIPNSLNVDDSPIPKNSWVAGRLLQNEAIASCVEFPEDVRLWSRRLAAIAPPGETKLAIFQRWWKENEAAFQAREYGKVKPGVLSIPGMKRSVMGNPPNFEDAAHPPSPPGATSAPGSATAQKRGAAEAPIGSVNEPSTPSLARLIAVVALALAMLWGVFVFAKTRR